MIDLDNEQFEEIINDLHQDISELRSNINLLHELFRNIEQTLEFTDKICLEVMKRGCAGIIQDE